jgi:hypothetical protein
MANLAMSPRQLRTPEERKAHDAQYKVKIKDFTAILQHLVQQFNALITLNTAFAKISVTDKGVPLLFPTTERPQDADPNNPNDWLELKRKDLRSANAKFAKAIKELKHYLRVCNKKTRDPTKPEDFRGTYTPVFGGDALRDFLQNGAANFGHVDPDDGASQALMDFLPMAKEGYFLRNTITMMFYIYAHAQNLQNSDNAQFTRSDDVMSHAFGGNIPAAFFSSRDTQGKPVKMLMTDYIQQGGQAYNTYDIIRSQYPEGTIKVGKDGKQKDIGFYANRFSTYYFQNIAALNYYPKAILESDANFQAQKDYLNQDTVRQAMLDEHALVKQVSEIWKNRLEPERKLQRDARKKRAGPKPKKAAGQ